MDFHLTVMGKRFFEGTLPRLAKGIEDLNEKLDKLTEAMSKSDSACPASAFGWANDEAEDAIMEQAEDVLSAQDDGGADLMAVIINEIITDSDGSALRLVERYRRASAIGRQVINGVFVELTGWSFTSLVKKYLETVKKQEEKEDSNERI